MIVAEKTIFRVHASILSRQSSRMSSILKERASSDVHEGLPVVTVDDSSHDFKHVLYILYDPDGFE